jgi:hypothetical protein
MNKKSVKVAVNATQIAPKPLVADEHAPAIGPLEEDSPEGMAHLAKLQAAAAAHGGVTVATPTSGESVATPQAGAGGTIVKPEQTPSLTDFFRDGSPVRRYSMDGGHSIIVTPDE